MMSAALIGTRLDATLDYPRHSDPTGTFPLLARLGTIGDAPAMSPREVSRLFLINRLRLSRLRSSEADAVDEDASNGYDVESLPTYRELVRSIISSKLPAPLTQFEEAATPGLIIRGDFGYPQAVLEIGYGFEPGEAMAAIGRLPSFAWAASSNVARSGTPGMVGYVLLHELTFGETIRETARSIDDWLGANFGPFNGIDRIGLPMMPRLTRTSSLSAHGARLSATDTSNQSTGYVAFCISYERAGF